MAQPQQILEKEERMFALWRMLSMKELCIYEMVDIFQVSESTVKDMCGYLMDYGHIEFESKLLPHISERKMRVYKATKLDFVPRTLQKIKDEFKDVRTVRKDGYTRYGEGKFFNPWVKMPELQLQGKKYSPLDYLDYSYQRIKKEPNRGIQSTMDVI